MFFSFFSVFLKLRVFILLVFFGFIVLVIGLVVYFLLNLKFVLMLIIFWYIGVMFRSGGYYYRCVFIFLFVMWYLLFN